MTSATPSPGDKPSFLRRIGLAFGAFIGVLSDAEMAARIAALRGGPGPTRSTAAPAAPSLKQASPDAALQLLALLQREARLIDFANEDIVGYGDAQIGAAARLVHAGWAKVLREHFALVSVRDE